jgi:MFS transporter, ACS family, tartrate transporter
MPFLFLLYVVAYIDRINISFAGLQMTGELHFSDAVFGFGSGVFFIGYVLLGIPGAVLVEKWSARKAMALTMLVWGCVASATGLIHTRTEFYGMRFLLGVTEAGFFPGVITFLGHWYSPRDRAKAVAVFMTAIPVAPLIAAPISAVVMKAHWFGLAGWRWLLILEGAPAVLCALLTWLYLTDRPHGAPWLPPDERDWLAAELDREHATKPARMSLLAALAHPDVLLLAAAYFGSTIGSYGLSLWLPKMLKHYGHLGNFWTTLLSAVPSLIAVPAMLVSGWHSDKTGERRWHTAVPRLAAAVALGAMAFEPPGLAVALLLFTIAFSGIVAGYPPLWAIPTSFLETTSAAASIGLINSIGNVGGFVGPDAIGWFSSRTGSYLGGLWCMSIAALLSAVFVLLVRARGTRVRPE